MNTYDLSNKQLLRRPLEPGLLMTVVEPLRPYDVEMYSDAGRVEVVRLVDLFGPISPELVLVDPQLAAHARALLPDALSARRPQMRELEPSAPYPPVLARGRRTIPWRLAGACGVVLAATTIGLGAWGTVLGNDAEPSQQPSAETEPSFFTTPPTEPDLSPGEIAALETAVQREPRSPLAREVLGTAYFRLGRWEDAESEFRALVDLSPADKFAHYALGRSLANQGRQGEASRQFELAGSLSDRGPSSADPLSSG